VTIFFQDIGKFGIIGCINEFKLGVCSENKELSILPQRLKVSKLC